MEFLNHIERAHQKFLGLDSVLNRIERSVGPLYLLPKSVAVDVANLKLNGDTTTHTRVGYKNSLRRWTKRVKFGQSYGVLKEKFSLENPAVQWESSSCASRVKENFDRGTLTLSYIDVNPVIGPAILRLVEASRAELQAGRTPECMRLWCAPEALPFPSAADQGTFFYDRPGGGGGGGDSLGTFDVVFDAIGASEAQRSAARFSFSQSHSAILGPPGTGKTLVIAAMAKVVSLQSRCLIVAPSNHAALSALLAIKKTWGDASVALCVSDTYFEYHKGMYEEHSLMQHVATCEWNEADAKATLSYAGNPSPRIVVSTPSMLLKQQLGELVGLDSFDTVIVDEGGALFEGMGLFLSSLLPPRARFVIVGDDCQLPPHCEHTLPEAPRSIFDAIPLTHRRSLDTSFRLFHSVCSVLSPSLYEGRLSCRRSPEVDAAFLASIFILP